MISDITWVHVTRQDLSFLTNLVFFDKTCFFQQDLFFQRQILSFSTRFVFYCVLKKTILVENNKICWKRQDLLKKLLKTTRFVEKDKTCRKKQVSSKKTTLVVIDERPCFSCGNSAMHYTRNTFFQRLKYDTSVKKPLESFAFSFHDIFAWIFI